MKTEDAIRHFGSRAELARQLGLTRATLTSWGPRVPPLRAVILEELTAGKLKFDPAEYRDWGRPGARVRLERAARVKPARHTVQGGTRPARRA